MTEKQRPDNMPLSSNGDLRVMPPQETANVPENQEDHTVGNVLRSYLSHALVDSFDFQYHHSPFTTEPWDGVLNKFTRDLDQRLKKADSHEELVQLVTPIVTRGVELVSGGIVSGKDIPEGGRRGTTVGGTWPDVPNAHFWDPREKKGEKEFIKELVSDVLKLNTEASEPHVGRVVTMSLPALISWADLRENMTPKNELIEAVKRLLESESVGKMDVVTFGCEPYQYKHEPNSTTTHFRRTEFGNEQLIREDAIEGSFRAALRILEPIALSGVDVNYSFYTSFGTSWDLIQRQVMPDTINFYQENGSPHQILTILRNWRQTIERIGTGVFNNSKVKLSIKEMETQVVLPALKSLGQVLKDCGMQMPDNMDEFYYNSEKWFSDHINELRLISVAQKHPDPMTLMNFLINENEWSKKHQDAYDSDESRVIQSALLSFFELHQYERINGIINSADIGLGVEIDEELIQFIRKRDEKLKINQSPLIWGRVPRFTSDGLPGGVAHRQPWLYG